MAKAKRKIVVRFREDRQKWEVDCRAVPGWRSRRPTFETEEEAHAYASKLLGELERGLPVPEHRDISLVTYVEERWLPAVSPDLERKTAEGYARLLRRHVLPQLGQLRLRDVRKRHIRALLNDKRTQGYAKNTVRLIKAALSSVLTDASEEDVIETNPALHLGRKKGRRAGTLTKADQQKTIRPIDWAQLCAFLKEGRREPPYGALFEVMALAGLRPGEALALQPGDLDLRNAVLQVERAMSGGRVKATKTYEIRKVDLAPGLLRTLKHHLGWLSEKTLRRGWGEPGWLFPSEANTLLDYANVAKVFLRILKRAKLPHFRVYDLRHTYASLLLSLGAPLLYVSQQMGHSNPATTLRFYARWVPSGDRRWVGLLDQGLADNLEPEVGTSEGAKNEGAPEAPDVTADLIGEPWRSRTSNLLIKSQLLYQLS